MREAWDAIAPPASMCRPADIRAMDAHTAVTVDTSPDAAHHTYSLC
jgi:hypothetical protein